MRVCVCLYTVVAFWDVQGTARVCAAHVCVF